MPNLPREYHGMDFWEVWQRIVPKKYKKDKEWAGQLEKTYKYWLTYTQTMSKLVHKENDQEMRKQMDYYLKDSHIDWPKMFY